jgi:hypothetical protein
MRKCESKTFIIFLYVIKNMTVIIAAKNIIIIISDDDIVFLLLCTSEQMDVNLNLGQKISPFFSRTQA